MVRLGKMISILNKELEVVMYHCTGHISTDSFHDFIKRELGPPRRNIRMFTEELSQTLDTPFISLVNSGSSANLVAAMMVKELQPDRNKVLLSAFSFPTTISAYKIVGFEVELVDIEANSFNMCLDRLEDEIDNDVAAVVPTHFLGFPAQVDKISSICKKHGALLVQDACETMNLEVSSHSIYEYGDIVTHSFYHPHHLSSYGGGAVVTKTSEDKKIAESIIHWGRACTCHYSPENCSAPDGVNHNFWYERLGLNVEMSELNACFGRFQLETWSAQEAKRKGRYSVLLDNLSQCNVATIFPANFNVSPFVFPISVPQNLFHTITGKLQEEGLEIRTLMGGAICLHPGYQFLYTEKLKQSELMGNTSFFVGIHQSILESDFVAIMNILRDVLMEYSK